MIKNLEVDRYLEGYNVSQLHCIDLSIAAGTGVFNTNNYYLYSCYNTIFNNWNYKSDAFATVQSLEKMNIKLKENTVQDFKQLIAFIKGKISSGFPVILPVKYDALFYDVNYLKEDFGNIHALLFTGYDEVRTLLFIMEYVHVREVFQGITNADVMSKLQLTEEIIFNIWNKSNCSFKGSEFHNLVYSLEKKNELEQPIAIRNFQELFEDVRNIYPNMKCNKFCELILNYEDNRSAFPTNQRTHYNSLNVLFKSIEGTFEVLNDVKSTISIQYYDIKDTILKKRYSTLQKLQIDKIRRKSQMNMNSYIKMAEEISSLDDELHNIIAIILSHGSTNYH